MPASARRILRASSTRRGPRVRRRAACSRTTTSLRWRIRSPGPGNADRRRRRLTPLPLFHFNAISVCVVGTLLVGGKRGIARRFSVSGSGRRCAGPGATIASMLGSLAILIADADDHPDQAGAPAAPVRGGRRCRPTSTASGTSASAARRSAAATGSPRRRSSRCSRRASRTSRARRASRTRTSSTSASSTTTTTRCRGEIGEIVCRPKGPHLMFAGYWRRPEATVEALPQPLVPHRRHRPARRRRLPLLRRPQEGLPAAAGREHLQLRDRAHAAGRTAAINDVAVHAVASELTEDDVKVTAVLASRRRAVTEEELCRWIVERPVLRPPALHRVPGRPAAQPGRPRAQVPAARRRRYADDLGPRGCRRHLRTPLRGTGQYAQNGTCAAR